MSAHTRIPFNRIMSTNGDGTGTIYQNANFSVTPGLFYVSPPAGQQYFITHMHVVVADNATLNMDDYGGIVGGLTNGIEFVKKIDGVETDIFQGFRVKWNVDYLMVVETEITTFAGTAQALLGVIFFQDSFTTSLLLNPGDYLGMRISDDLSTLSRQYAAVWGIRQDAP